MAWRAHKRYMLYNICIILFINVRLSKIIFFSVHFLSLFMCSMINEQTLNLFASIEPYIWFLKQAKNAFTLTIFTFLTKIPSKCTLILLALIFMFAQWECSCRVSSVLWSRLGNDVWSTYVLHENDKTWYSVFISDFSINFLIKKELFLLFYLYMMSSPFILIWEKWLQSISRIKLI